MLGVNILTFVLVLMVLVLVHEWGHLVVAKRCGMRVERFSIFFGRPLAAFRRGETQYAIGWLPLGGYVKISGMTRGEDIPPEVESRAYYNAATWKRVATILAGPAVNIALAVVLFIVAFWIPGGPGQVVNRVASVDPGTPAAAIGLQQGDRLVSVNGAGGGDDLPALQREIQRSPERAVDVVIARDGTRLERSVTPARVRLSDGTEIGRLGFTFDSEPYGFLGGLRAGVSFTGEVIEANVNAIGQLFTSSEAREQVNSIVGIGAIYNEVADSGLVVVVRFIALISLALGIFNLLPLLPLDGGHILFALFEKVRGKALSRAAYERASLVGFALLAIVLVVVVQNDIGRIRGDGFGID